MTSNTTEASDAGKAVRDAKENEAAFAAGFEAIRSGEEADSQEPATAAATPEAEPPADEAPIEEALFAGFTETQLKALLAKAAQVDDLEKQIAKAHGKIGEFNRTLQEYQAREVKPAATTEQLGDGPSDSELESDYPDIAKLADIRARKIVDEAMKARPAETGAPAAEVASEIANVRRETQEEIMGVLHGKDWRDVITSTDYKTWLATQPEEIQKRATETPRATELSEVISSFKSWKDGGVRNQNSSRSRLEAGLTPKGVSSGKQQVGPTEHDEFRAGFNSVRGS